jgi:fatty-acid peroxygenase
MSRATLPSAPQFDSTLTFWRNGYRFISATCDALQSDIFSCRLMFRKAVCICGPEAAAAFYAPNRFTRQGAVPSFAVSLLQDYGSVQSLDGAAHHHRKRLFMSVMTYESIARALSWFGAEWDSVFSHAGKHVLLDDASSILCRTALRWCGLDPNANDAEDRTAEFNAMIAGAGSIGWRQIRGQRLRRRSEDWARRVIQAERNSAGRAKAGPAQVIALARDHGGKLLPEDVAAIELINLLRPTVAAARFVTFAAHALNNSPHWRPALLEDVMVRQAFAQEVRRYYPFVPAIGGKVISRFEWAGHRFKAGDWVLLDIYGTNRHPAWGDPELFRPERFLDDRKKQHWLVAQGSGDPYLDHRCPGEDLTIALLMESLRLLAGMDYDVPEQNLSIPLNTMPTAPRSGFVMTL